MPASPLKSASWPAPRLARSQSENKSSTSRSRPTSWVRPWANDRSKRLLLESAATRRCASTGRKLSGGAGTETGASASIGAVVNSPRTICSVPVLIETVPRSALSASRFATVGASPRIIGTRGCPATGISSTITVPVWIPIRTAGHAPSPSCSRSISARICIAARAARSASSSWAAGYPKQASILPPNELRMVPSNRSICRAKTWPYARSASHTSSESA